MKILYFGAEHCPQCKVLRPRVESWCNDRGGEFTFCDADSREWVDTLPYYGIRSIPTVVVIDGDRACNYRGIDGWNKFLEESE